MSASDEFLFFPLVEESFDYRGSMEDLSPDLIQEALARSKRALSLAGKTGRDQEKNLDLQIDARLLAMHADNFIRTFEVEKEHLRDPSLYFRIAVHGLALAADDPGSLQGRIQGAAGLLRCGEKQLSCTSARKVEQGLVWSSNFRNFLTELARLKHLEKNPEALHGLARLRSAADSFARRLEGLEHSSEPESLGRERYSMLLKGAFALQEDPRELYELLQAERRRLAEILHQGAVRQGYRADQWRLAAVDTPPVQQNSPEPIEFYRAELERLARWLGSRPEAGDIDLGLLPEIRPMPGYLRGLRASASYAAGLGPGNHGVFFVGFLGEGRKSRERLALHSDYRYITVHETFPGHHHLDTVRRKLKSAVRRQSENALFYEGWSCWAEQRMADLGYFSRPNELMCLERRKYQRCLRSICDLGLHLGALDDGGAAQLLGEFGWKGKLASQCILQYRCQPGYQLTYTIGRLEMERLIKRFRAAASSDREFYQALLGAGEIPFSLLERWLESRFCNVPQSDGT